MPLTTLIETGLNALLDGPVIEVLGQRAGNKAISILHEHFTLSAFEMAQAYQKSYGYALAAIGAGLAAPEAKFNFIRQLKHSKIEREFADQIEVVYLRPFAAQQGVHDEGALHALRTQLIDNIKDLSKWPPIFSAEERPLSEAELAAVISHQGALAITDLVLEQLRGVQAQLEDETQLDETLVAFFRHEELLGNAVLFFFREILRKEPRVEKTLTVLHRKGLMAEVREIKKTQQRFVRHLQRQLDKQTAVVKAAVEAGDFTTVNQLSAQLVRLQQSIAEVPSKLEAAQAAWQRSHQSLIAFAQRFESWAKLLDDKVEQVLAAMDGLHSTVVRIDENVEALLKKVDELMRRFELSPQIKARDEFRPHNSTSLALIQEAVTQLNALDVPPFGKAEPGKMSGISGILAIKTGSVLFSTGDVNNLTEAERLFVQARNTTQVPAEKALASFNLFQVRLRRKAYDDALADLQTALAIDPNYALHDINKYPMVRILGAGGMGCVFLCHNQWGEGDKVVVKCFWEGRKGSHQQIFGEAMKMRQIAGAYVPMPLDCGYVNAVQQERPFFVTEYLEGALDGETWLKKHGKLDVPTGIAVGIQIAKGLQVAHEHGIYHLDIKPANLLFKATETGLMVKIIDFGLARVATSLQQHALSRSRASEMTQMAQGIFLGTLFYAPPEQFGDTQYGQPGAKSDLFSMGAALYRLMTEESPQNLNPLRLADAPAELFQLLCECKEQNPAQRPDSAQQLASRLKALPQVKTEADIEPERKRPVQPAPKPEKRRSFLPLTAFAVLIVIVLVALTWFNLPSDTGQTPTADNQTVQPTPLISEQPEKSDTGQTQTADNQTVQPTPLISERPEKSDTGQTPTADNQTVQPAPLISARQEKSDTEQTSVANNKTVQPAASEKSDKPTADSNLEQKPAAIEEVFRDRLKDGRDGPEMIWIPAGRFQMGDIQGGGDSDEKPLHWVSVKKFAMGRYEVTNAEFLRFLNAVKRRGTQEEPWFETKSEDSDSHIIGSVGNFKVEVGYENHPMIEVSWYGATAYAKWLSQQTGQQYRLPTEAQWEYAARAGTTTKYWWGNDIGSNKANCYSDSCGDSFEYTAPVGSFAPNQFGLYDTVGNVWEWTCSEYEDKYTGKEQRCVKSAGRFAARGGSWGYKAGGGAVGEPLRGHAVSPRRRAGCAACQDAVTLCTFPFYPFPFLPREARPRFFGYNHNYIMVIIGPYLFRPRLEAENTVQKGKD
jgi:formylglycine-generating enzyme required for sulfatase activity/tetratricopeptide (TPR) repeat protein